MSGVLYVKKIRVLAVADVLATARVPPTRAADTPIRALAPVAISRPLPAVIISTLPEATDRFPEVRTTSPVPFGVNVRLMAALVPVADQTLPFSRDEVAAAPVVMLATDGVRLPPRESQVATPPPTEAIPKKVPETLFTQIWPRIYPVSEVVGSRRATIGVGN